MDVGPYEEDEARKVFSSYNIFPPKWEVDAPISFTH